MAKKNQNRKRQENNLEEIRQAREAVVADKKDKQKKSNGDAYRSDAEAKPSMEVKPSKEVKDKPGLERLSFDDQDISVSEEVQEKVKLPIKELEGLEQALSREKIPSFVRESEYTRELSREPVQALYDQAKALASLAEEKGYLSSTEQRQLQYITGAIEEKVEGEYSFTEETARKASLILELASESRQLYKGTNSNQKSWYKSG